MAKHNLEKLTKVRIEVTDRLIKRGVPNHTVWCPFALALQKVLAKNVAVDVDYEEIALELQFSQDDCDMQQIKTPASVSKFKERFDAHDPDNDDNFDEDGNLVVELPPLPKPFSIN